MNVGVSISGGCGNDGSGANGSVLRNDGDDDNRQNVMTPSSLRGAVTIAKGLHPLASAVIGRIMMLRLEVVRMEMQQGDDTATDEDVVEEEYDDGEDVDEDDDDLNNNER